MLSRSEIRAALEDPDARALFAEADWIRAACVGEVVYIRGLLEMSNVCVRNCLYCGLRRDHSQLQRYRLTVQDVLGVAEDLYRRGLRTIVLQSGDGAYGRSEIIECIATIKHRFPDMAVTLSLGERPLDDYVAFREAGADRYLLKHETINPQLYSRLHPGQSWRRRLRILEHLRTWGYQVGTGFIVGLPGQSREHLVEEILFLQQFQPDMIGLGPFLPQRNTPLAQQPAGGFDLTLRCLALARCATRDALIPATTALISLRPADGLEAGLRAGANVVMVNSTPPELREQYAIYDGRSRLLLEAVWERVIRVGRRPSSARGDSLKRADAPGRDPALQHSKPQAAK